MSGTVGDNIYRASGVIAAAAAGGGVSWQAVETGATFTAVAGNGYPVNTTAQACTVTLPAAASVGDEIIFTDYLRTWATYAVTINQNSLKFQGNATPNPVYDTNGESIHIVYMDATQGWVPINDGAVVFETPQTIDFLVVGGGGGGGTGTNSAYREAGGGGGAGGYRTSTENYPSSVTLTATVGDGGAATSGATQSGSVGSVSSIAGTGITTISSAGGGFGARDTVVGGVGGSGGGGGGGNPGGGGGAGNTPSTDPVQGFAGGDGASAGAQGGGGGGASELGSTDGAADGGDGTSSSITGSAVTYAGGGGATPSGTGGEGGGGAGAGHHTGTGGTGTANLGGGGGGSSYTDASGAGGKGVVIMKMLTSLYSGNTTGSPTEDTSGSFTILTFTGTGTYIS